MAGNKTFFKLFIFLTLLYLAFQAKPWGSVSGAIFAGDDHSYYGYISSLVNDFDLDFSNNQLSGHSGVSPVTDKIVVGHPIGTSILLMPFYLVAKPIVCLLHWLRATPYNQKHPLFFMFMCSGIIVYAYLGGYLLSRTILRLGISRRISTIAVLLSIWGTILPAYIFRRPIFTHTPEFFLIALILYLIVKWKYYEFRTLRQLFFLSFISGIMIITRWNNIHILGFVAYWLFMQRSLFARTLKGRVVILAIFPLTVILIFFLTQSLAWKYFYGSYFTLFPLNKGATLFEIFSLSGLKNLIHIFSGFDWGLFYTMFPFVVGFIGFLIFNPLSLSKKGMLERLFYGILFSLPFVIVLRWRRQADYYGYRYLLSLLPFACIGLAALFDKLCKMRPNCEKLLSFLMVGILAFNFLLLLPFEYQKATNLERGLSLMGGNGFVNNSYVANAGKFYFSSSPKILIGSFTRGFLGGYIIGGIYLTFPDYFLKIAAIDERIQKYYALDSFKKRVVLIYPVLVIFMLFIANILISKIVINKDK